MPARRIGELAACWVESRNTGRGSGYEVCGASTLGCRYHPHHLDFPDQCCFDSPEIEKSTEHETGADRRRNGYDSTIKEMDQRPHAHRSTRYDTAFQNTCRRLFEALLSHEDPPPFRADDYHERQSRK